MILGNVKHLLLEKLIAALPGDSRIALCGGGKFLNTIWAELREMLQGRPLVAVLDDGAARAGQRAIHTLPVRSLSWATRSRLDAILITSEHYEPWFARTLAPLQADGVTLIRTAHVAQNDCISAALVEELLNDKRLDLHARPTPWNDPLPRVPLWAGLEITTGCNLNCLMCETHSSRRPTGQMELEFFERALDELDRLGIKYLTLHTIGEPTIHKRFRDVLRISHERGFDVWLSTNGQLLDRFFDALRQWPVKTIRWSVDGATRDTYERIRLGGKFDKLLSNLQRMRALIRENSLPTRMEMNVTLSADNLDETATFFEVYGPLLDDDQIHFSIVNSLSAGDGSYYESVRLLDNPPQAPCAPLWQSLYVGYDGQVSACCRDYHGELIVGDLKTASLEQIWNGPKLNDLRDKHAAGDIAALPRACQTCFCADYGETELFAALIAALRRERPRLNATQFTGRLRAFLQKLARHANQRRTAIQAAPRGRPLPVLVGAGAS